jgi:hypothetical protein
MVFRDNMKKLLLVMIGFSLLGLFCGCGGKTAVTAVLTDLTSNPQSFNGKTITVEGVYISGWESTVLAEDISFTVKDNTKELNISGTPVWFAGTLPLEIQNKLYQNTSPAAGPQHFGKIIATGLFEYGGNYGYGKIYKYRITASKIELLDWEPPE